MSLQGHQGEPADPQKVNLRKRRCVYLTAASSLCRLCCSARISLRSCLADFCSSTHSSISSLVEAKVSSFPTRVCRIFSFSPDYTEHSPLIHTPRESAQTVEAGPQVGRSYPPGVRS